MNPVNPNFASTPPNYEIDSSPARGGDAGGQQLLANRRVSVGQPDSPRRSMSGGSGAGPSRSADRAAYLRNYKKVNEAKILARANSPEGKARKAANDARYRARHAAKIAAKRNDPLTVEARRAAQRTDQAKAARNERNRQKRIKATPEVIEEKHVAKAVVKAAKAAEALALKNERGAAANPSNAAPSGAYAGNQPYADRGQQAQGVGYPGYPQGVGSWQGFDGQPAGGSALHQEFAAPGGVHAGNQPYADRGQQAQGVGYRGYPQGVASWQGFDGQPAGGQGGYPSHTEAEAMAKRTADYKHASYSAGRSGEVQQHQSGSGAGFDLLVREALGGYDLTTKTPTAEVAKHIVPAANERQMAKRPIFQSASNPNNATRRHEQPYSLDIIPYLHRKVMTPSARNAVKSLQFLLQNPGAREHHELKYFQVIDSISDANMKKTTPHAKTHPTVGMRGVIARAPIPSGTPLIYSGQPVSEGEFDVHAQRLADQFQVLLNDAISPDDALKAAEEQLRSYTWVAPIAAAAKAGVPVCSYGAGNVSAFINHQDEKRAQGRGYTGPNMSMYFLSTTAANREESPAIAMYYTTNNVAQGEQLLVSYGKDYDFTSLQPKGSVARPITDVQGQNHLDWGVTPVKREPT